jgi:hypothetical protein
VIEIVRVLDTESFSVLDHNGVARTTILENWAEQANLTPGENCTIALVHTKHGLAYMVWADNQPTFDDLGEDL